MCRGYFYLYVNCISNEYFIVAMSSTYPVVENIEDSTGGIRRRRTDTTKGEQKRTKGQTMIYKTLRRKLKIEQHKSQ
jgi:hypothetical protein